MSSASGEGQSAVCLNHPEIPAVCVCSVCAEPFCAECVDAPGLAATCDPCREADRARGLAQGDVEPINTAATHLAGEALTMSIIGILCFGIVLEPWALIKATRARREIKASKVPVNGAGKATAAIIIACSVFALWIIGVLAKLAETP